MISYNYDQPNLALASIVIVLDIVSLALCIVAEFKKSKKKDLVLDGKLCGLPESGAFVLGIVALMCFLIAQIIRSFLICKNSCLVRIITRTSSGKATMVSTIVFSLSWLSFGIAVILISTATSMNGRQPMGEGWVDGECYLVKSGVYSGSAILVVLTLSSTLVSSITLKKSQAEHAPKVHAQVG